jgi:ligand-binding sensor domain-containing protein/serine phosphatase RsbU (regulator of sigma subunit)
MRCSISFRLLRKTFLFLIIVFSSFSASAQQLNFTSFGVENGLPQSTVFEIFQDRDDFLWIGTDGGGLCRYDGFRFKTYGKANGLKSNVVRKITQDKEGVLWIATDQGLHYMQQEKIQSFDQIPDNNSLYITTVFVDSKENIWVATSGKGVFYLQRKDSAFSIDHLTSTNLLASDFVFDVLEDEKGFIWLAHFENGIEVYSPSSKKTKHYKSSESLLNEVISLCNLNNDEILAGTKRSGAFLINKKSPDRFQRIPSTGPAMVWSCTKDNKNKYWISTNDKGVVCSSPENNLSPDNGLPSAKALKTIIDRENNIWVGMLDAGLVKFSGKRFSHITSRDVPGINQVSAIQKLNNAYWLGTPFGLYELSFNAQKVFQKRILSQASGLPASDITSLASNKSGLWIGTREKGLSLYDGSRIKTFTEKDELVNNNVNCILALEDQVWIGTSGGLSLLTKDNKFVSVSESNGLVNNEVQCLHRDHSGNIWIGTLGGIVRNNGKELYTFNEEDGITEKKINCFAEDKNGGIYIGTASGGIFKYDEKKQKLNRLVLPEAMKAENIYAMTFCKDSILIATTNQGIYKITFNGKGAAKHLQFFGKADGLATLENSLKAIYSDGDTIWIGTSKGVTLYYPGNDFANTTQPKLKIDALKINGAPFESESPLYLNHDQNNLSVEFSSISLTNPLSNKYYVKLLGYDTSWISVRIDENQVEYFAKAEYKKLPPGSYTLQVKSSNNSDVESETFSLVLTIKPPFYKTTGFIVASALCFAGLLIIFFKLREKNLIREKVKLEKIVTERTAEVVANKIEIENQKDLLEHQKKEITDSINYSKRIQNAILPEKEIFFKNFPDSFLIYQPKDIVSGDFYFINQKDNKQFFIGAADCTGHGVPGAFMSMIGSKELAEAVSTSDRPSFILSALNKGIRKTLKQNDVELGVKDGMDIAFISIAKNENTGQLQVVYAGANRPLWILRKDAVQIEEIKATKTAIGGYTLDDQVFEEHTLTLEKGDAVYLFSDGYADQFGGKSGKKMMTKQFKENLISIKSRGMSAQGEFLLEYFNNWKGDVNEQVDDVLVIGIRA